MKGREVGKQSAGKVRPGGASQTEAILMFFLQKKKSGHGALQLGLDPLCCTGKAWRKE
jgi:hypothetical protein